MLLHLVARLIRQQAKPQHADRAVTGL